MKKLCTLLSLLLLFTACATQNPPRFIGYTQEVITPEDSENVSEIPERFDVFFRRDNVSFAMHEPSEGAYAAAWLAPGAGIRGFEYAAGMRHAVYVNEMRLGDEIDIAWLLHCIASQAAPLIIVHPPENSRLETISQFNEFTEWEFTESELTESELTESELATILAQRLGAFNLPMFIVFYPEHDLTPMEFTTAFRAARNIFLTHAPMAAFVWSAPCYTATPQHALYPGHFAADWVALPLLADWCANQGFSDVLTGLEQFYNAFHDYKPIMILPLGVSHFTRGDYSYRIDDAGAEITRIYNALQNFPRVGLIAYADAFTLTRMYNNDFSVSRETNLIQSYGEAASHLLPTLNHRDHAETHRWVRSTHHGYLYQNQLYISLHTAENELQLPTTPHQISQINEQLFIPADVIRKIFACFDLQIIFVDNSP